MKARVAARVALAGLVLVALAGAAAVTIRVSWPAAIGVWVGAAAFASLVAALLKIGFPR